MALFSKISSVFLSLFIASSSQGIAEDIPDPAAAAASVRRTGWVTGDGVHLRAGPGLSSEILARLPRQTEVAVRAEEGEWIAVELPDSISAYIHRDFLTVEGAWAAVRGERVKVRAGPGVTHDSFGTLSAPERVEVREAVGDWVKVRPPRFCRGWIYRGYLVIVKEEPVPAQERTHGDD